MMNSVQIATPQTSKISEKILSNAPNTLGKKRKAERRPYCFRCQAVRLSDFKLIGDVAVDVSSDGIRIETDELVQNGDEILVSFEIQGVEESQVRSSQRWVDAEGRVARVCQGRRSYDSGARSFGVRFDELSEEAKQALGIFLAA